MKRDRHPKNINQSRNIYPMAQWWSKSQYIGQHQLRVAKWMQDGAPSRARVQKRDMAVAEFGWVYGRYFTN
jgi:hypothetical protein